MILFSSFRFHINSRTWAIEVNINKCAINNKPLERCPLQVSVRSGGLPSEWGTDTLHKNCSQSAVGKPCHINFVGPITNTFQYLKLIKGGNQNLSFSISLKVKGKILIIFCDFLKHCLLDILISK